MTAGAVTLRLTDEERGVLRQIEAGGRWTRSRRTPSEDWDYYLWPDGKVLSARAVNALVKKCLLDATPYSPICGDGGGFLR